MIISKEAQRIFDFLNLGYDVEIGWISKKIEGEIDHTKEKIILNLDLLIAGVFVHEWLHNENPTDEESVIWEKTEKVLSRLKVEEIKMITQTILKRAGLLNL